MEIHHPLKSQWLQKIKITSEDWKEISAFEAGSRVSWQV